MELPCAARSLFVIGVSTSNFQRLLYRARTVDQHHSSASVNWCKLRSRRFECGMEEKCQFSNSLRTWEAASMTRAYDFRIRLHIWPKMEHYRKIYAWAPHAIMTPLRNLRTPSLSQWKIFALASAALALPLIVQFVYLFIRIYIYALSLIATPRTGKW